MAFSGWGRRCELVIQSSQVTQDCTDFPVLVHEDSLPSEIFDADGSYPALNGGGDLRFSSDQAGDSRLPCEVEQFITDNDPANGKSAVWVKRTLSSASNTSIWVYYNNPGEVQPSETDPYGKHAVWDNDYMMVQHMNQDPSGSAPQMIDSTSNSNDGTSVGAMSSADLVDGQIGKCLDFDNNDDKINIDSLLTTLANKTIGTISFITKMNSNLAAIESVFMLEATSGDRTELQFLYDTRSGHTRLDAICLVDTIQKWRWWSVDLDPFIGQHIFATVSHNGTQACAYVNGAISGSFAAEPDKTSWFKALITDATNPADTVNIESFNGLVDEVRVSDITRSANWILTEYNNQNSPATFIIEGTPETPPLSPPSSPTNVQASDGTYIDKVRITWSASSEAISYEVYRSGTENSFKILLDSPSETIFNDETAVISVTYYYWVKAINAAGSSDYSSYNTGWRKTDVFIWPTTLSAPQKKLSIIPGDTRIERKLQSGRTEFRRFGDSKPDQAKVLFRLLWAQWDTFRQFYEYDLSLGCNWFSASWLPGLGYSDHKAKFLGYPREVARQGYYVDIVCTLMIQKSEWAYTDVTWPMGAAPIPPPPPPPTYSGYIYGGYSDSTLQDCDCFYAEAWTSKTNMPLPARSGHAASTIDNKGYVYAGEGLSDCDEYTPTPDTWASKTNVSGYHKRPWPAGFTIESTGYVFNGGEASTGYSATCDKYNPDTWTYLGTFSGHMRGQAVTVIGSNAYLFGGKSGTHSYATKYCIKYNPSDNTYTFQTHMSDYNHYGVAFTLNDKGYLCGGIKGYTSSAWTNIRTCKEYVPDVWVSKTDMPNPARSRYAGSDIEYKGYLYGGENLQDCDQYTPDLDFWTSKENMPWPARKYLAASTI